MSESQRFPFRPFPPGDPGPEIWAIIRELEIEKQLQVVHVVLSAEIAMAEARVSGLRELQKIVAR